MRLLKKSLVPTATNSNDGNNSYTGQLNTEGKTKIRKNSTSVYVLHYIYTEIHLSGYMQHTCNVTKFSMQITHQVLILLKSLVNIKRKHLIKMANCTSHSICPLIAILCQSFLLNYVTAKSTYEKKWLIFNF